MAGWNGSGTFTGETYTWVNDLNAGIPITASRMDTQFSDVTTGINACMAKNGENAATGNLNIGGFRLTSVGSGTSRTDAATVGQLQDDLVSYVVASGINTITAAPSPSIPAYANGQVFYIKIANTTTASSTLAISGLSALNLYYMDGVTQIVAGALIQNGIYEIIYDSSLNSAAGGFYVANPSRVTGSFTITLTGMSGATTGAINYAIGNDGKGIDIWYANNILGTSNATTMTGTGIPAIIQSATDHPGIINVVNSGANLFGSISNFNNSTWIFGNGPLGTSSTWSNTGLKGLQVFGFRYMKD